MRRTRKAAACREDCTSAMRQRLNAAIPSASAPSAPDSTSPRSAAAAMNGLPSARRSITLTASSGSGPGHRFDQLAHMGGLERGQRQMSDGLKRAQRMARPELPPTETRRPQGSGVRRSAVRRCQLLRTLSVNWSAHWQSSSSTSTGRPVAPKASRSAVNACTLRVSANVFGAQLRDRTLNQTALPTPAGRNRPPPGGLPIRFGSSPPRPVPSVLSRSTLPPLPSAVETDVGRPGPGPARAGSRPPAVRRAGRIRPAGGTLPPPDSASSSTRPPWPSCVRFNWAWSVANSCPRPTNAGSVSVRRRSCNPTTRAGSDSPRCNASAITVKIGDHGLRRLVAVAWILAQQSLDDFIQHARHRQTQAAQFGRLHRHVLTQDFADTCPPGTGAGRQGTRRAQFPPSTSRSTR